MWRIARRANVDFSNRLDTNGTQNTREHTVLLQDCLQRQRVDHRRQHAHVVAGRPADSHRCAGYATMEIATTNHESDFDTYLFDAFDLGSDEFQLGGINAETAIPCQLFARDF